MKSWRLWALYGLLLALSLAAALQSRNPAPSSQLPSVDNAAAGGLKALFLYLSERGRPAHAWREPLAQLPGNARVLVLAAPVGRPVTTGEREALERFVQAGNTLVYLSPRQGPLKQPQLQDWWEMEPGPIRPPAGLTQKQELPILEPLGPFRGLTTLHIAPARGLAMKSTDWLPVAAEGKDVMVWYSPLGKGQRYAFSGTDIAENRGLEQGQNLDFWEQLSLRGPIYFDELHHLPPPPPPPSRAMTLTLLQLALLIGFFYWARGVRLGPARPLLQEQHRSTQEYLSSFAWLLRRARVERELALALRQRLRRRLWQSANIPITASDDDAALRWAEASGRPAEALLRWLKRAGATTPLSPGEYARLSAEAAALENPGSAS